MTEPTDAELMATFKAACGYGDCCDQGHPFVRPQALRAVLRRWGQPAVAGEPVAFLVCTEEGDPDMVFLNRHEAQQYLEDHERPIPLYTTPQPTQAQAGAAPLTDEPDCGGESCDCRSYCKKKGGQHGTDT